MANLAYEKAINYENLVNQELQRRYNTLNMYQTLYNMGQIPYQQDIQNWQIRNKNKDIAYENAKAQKQADMGTLGTLGSIALGIAGNALLPGVGGAIGSKLGGMIGNLGSGGGVATGITPSII